MNYSSDLNDRAKGHQNETQSRPVKNQPADGSSSALAAVRAR